MRYLERLNLGVWSVSGSERLNWCVTNGCHSLFDMHHFSTLAMGIGGEACTFAIEHHVMIRSITLSLVLLGATALHAQQVTTILDAATQVDDALFRDPSGNLYGSHYMGSNVYKMTPDGTVTTFLSGLNTPNGIAMNSLGEFYVADNVGNRIYRIASDGTPIDTITVIKPSGLLKAWDSDTILFTQYQPDKLGKLAPDGTITIVHEGAPLNGSVGLAHTDDGTLYVANFTDREIYRVMDAELEYVATVPGPSNGVLGFITGAGGTLFGTSWNSHAIYAIEPGYVDSVRLVAGGNGQGNADGDVSIAQFNQPNGILAVAGGDTIYVSDFASKNIRMITGVLTGVRELPPAAPLSIIADRTGASIVVALVRPLSGSGIFDLYDAQGRIILSRFAPPGEQRFTLRGSTLTPGVYTLTLKADSYHATGRFVW